jgi:hypothetical protein
MALGGGIDKNISDKISWRLFQGNYLMTQFRGNAQNNFRSSTGIIIQV